MFVLSALGLVIIWWRCRSGKVVCSAPPTHRADSLTHCQSEWSLNKTTNKSIQWRPILRQSTFSDFACWIGADNICTAPKASNAAKHTKQICSRTRPSLPKHFRRPTVGPVCSCHKGDTAFVATKKRIILVGSHNISSCVCGDRNRCYFKQDVLTWSSHVCCTKVRAQPLTIFLLENVSIIFWLYIKTKIITISLVQ